jgi:uncharacterized OB-fold protein
MGGITARNWREIPYRYRMEAAKCTNCGKIFFPRRLVCDNCGNRKFNKINLPNQGKLLTFTIIRVAPEGFADQAPYAVGVVELVGNVRFTTQIVDIPLDDIKIGMPVKVEFRKVRDDGPAGIHCYGYKCVPA